MVNAGPKPDSGCVSCRWFRGLALAAVAVALALWIAPHAVG